MKPVLYVETSQGLKLRLPLEFEQVGDKVVTGVDCRLVDADAEELIAMMTIDFDAKVRVYAGPRADEVWTNVEPHPLAGESGVASARDFRPAEEDE